MRRRFRVSARSRLERIPAGTRLIEYAGERLTPAQADARYPDGDDERHHTYLFAIDDDIVIDAAVDGNEARFINHSCDPNCDAVIDDGADLDRDDPRHRAGRRAGIRLRVRLGGAPYARGEAPLPVHLRRSELSRDDTREEAVRRTG